MTAVLVAIALGGSLVAIAPTPATIHSVTVVATPTVAPTSSLTRGERRGGPPPVGIASWYRYRPNEAAAGPALRDYIGANWRGSRVRVCARSACVDVTLTDWCGCYGTRVIDLDRASFAVLAAPSRGLVRVTVKVIPR